jgi:hypothetical protein
LVVAFPPPSIPSLAGLPKGGEKATKVVSFPFPPSLWAKNPLGGKEKGSFSKGVLKQPRF